LPSLRVKSADGGDLTHCQVARLGVLTRAYTTEQVCELATGPSEVVRLLAAGLGRP
jgi:hypothetical protein